MGIQITIPNTNFTNFFDMTKYPISDKLSALFYLGNTASQSVKNHARKSADATVVGTLSYGENYALFPNGQNVNYIETKEIDDTNDMTIITVYRKPQQFVAGRAIFGNLDSSVVNEGIVVMRDLHTIISNDTTYALQTSGTGGNTQVYYSFSVSVISGNTLTTFYHNGADVVAKSSVSLDRTLKTDKNLLIGGDYVKNTVDDQIEISMLAYHKKALTLDDIKSVYSYLTSYYAKKGVDFR